MSIGFIGTGNMAEAIIKGIIAKGSFKSEEIFAYDIDSEKLGICSKNYCINAVKDLNELIDSSDVVVLAVKPNVFQTLLPQIDGKLKEKNPLIISIAAGKTLEFILSFLSYDAKIIRVMPNMNAKVGSAISAYCPNNNASDADKNVAKSLCDSIGETIELDEKYFPLFGVIGGCAPAYTYFFIDSLAEAAVKNGMSKEQSLYIAAQTVLGSAKMILESDEAPWDLIKKVCSPGGTTIEGIESLKADNFGDVVIKAAQASLDKDKRI